MSGRPTRIAERSESGSAFRAPDGRTVKKPACGVTMSRLSDGTWRCWKCTIAAGPEHWTSRSAGTMLAHLATHGERGEVPAEYLARGIRAWARENRIVL